METAYSEITAKSKWLIPDGTYVCEIEKAENRIMKNGLGEFVHLEMRLIHKTFFRRRLFENITTRHAKNWEAQEIGRKIFVGFLKALQMKRCEDLNEIVGKKIRVQVGTRQNREKNKKENAVLKYLPMEDVNAGTL